MEKERSKERPKSAGLPKTEPRILMTSLEAKIMNDHSDWLILHEFAKVGTKHSDPLPKNDYIEIINELHTRLRRMGNTDLENLRNWLSGQPFNLLNNIYETKSIYIANNYENWGDEIRNEEKKKATALLMMKRETESLKRAIERAEERNKIKEKTRSKVKKVKAIKTE